MASKTVVMTGGHAGTTALATIQAFKKLAVETQVMWIGVEGAVEGSKAKTLEAQVFPGLGVVFRAITMGRLQRRFTRHTLPSLMRIPIGCLQAYRILSKARPAVVLSFGGAAAVPVVIAAWLQRRPVILHEQTAAQGLANKLSAPFATKIALARAESKSLFPQAKTVLIGNPVNAHMASVRLKTAIPAKPHILIIGGSRGARVINELVLNALPELTDAYTVTHLVGQLSFEDFAKLAASLPANKRGNYEVYDFVHPDAMAQLYQAADMVVSRAGANTVSELLVANRPAVLIPIPWSRYDEQRKNAALAQKVGLAVVMKQEGATSGALLKALHTLRGRGVPRAPSDYRELDLGAAHALASLTKSYMQ